MHKVLVDLPIHIPLGETYRYMGFPEHLKNIPPQIAQMAEEEIAQSITFIVPRATYYTCDYDAEQFIVYNKERKLSVLGAGIRTHLAQCTKATLFTCTVGQTIETKIDAYFKAGEFTRALILDAIGSAAVEYVADTLNQYLHNAAYHEQFSLVSRFSPGYGGWDLAIQKDLVSMAGGIEIGIEVTETSLLIPRKSVSGIIGWIPGLNSILQSTSSPCDICQIRRCKNPICKGGKPS